MLELFQMWAMVEVLGFVFLPLTVTVFHNLPDRGWAFSKAIGMAVLAFGVWLPLMYIHALPFNRLFILGIVLLLTAANVVGLLRTRQTIMKVVRANFTYVLVSEAVFLGMVFLLGYLRSYSPDIRYYEMPMDEGFIAAIMRSPHFPPNDMWFSGYPINYYYYAHFTIAVLAKLLGQTPSIAFNTGISIFFGLTATSLFGVTCNIIAWGRHLRVKAKSAPEAPVAAPATTYPSLLPAIPFGFLTFIIALILGNLASTQEWWKLHGDATQYDWFWPTTRVVDNTINEFPAFSFLLSCFHAHVLTLAFTIVAIGLAFNLLLEPEGKGLFVFGRGWSLVFTMSATALILGGLFTMNGWDFPTYVGLTLVCIIFQQWLAYQGRFRLELVLDIFTAGAGLTALSFILYAPFYFNFISPSQGIGIVGPNDRSKLSEEVLIYGLFAFVFLSLLFASAFRRRLFVQPAAEAGTAPVSPLYGWLNVRTISVAVLVLAGLIVVVVVKNSTTFLIAGAIAALGFLLTLYHLRERSLSFTLLLGTLAFTLVAGCEIFYLKDVFADSYPRMNTVFKFYFQAWALLSITSGVGLYFIMESFHLTPVLTMPQRWLRWGTELLWSVGLSLLLLAGMVYPVVGSYARLNHFTQRTNSLDGLDYLQYSDPGDYTAIRWLNDHVSGDPVIIEAIGSDYSDYARISSFTGLPTPMGWVGHEYQWRVNWMNKDLNSIEFNKRGGDIGVIYTSLNPAGVLDVMARYQAQYLYVGPLEEMKFPQADLHRFAAYMNVAYSANGVTIYQVRAARSQG
jgi:YYY domain-containing protein